MAGLAIAADHLCNSMETLCDHWEIPEDVGGATFMAFGGAVPEITVNAISSLKSLVEHSRYQHISKKKSSPVDLGVGAILGSGMIAFLVIPALCTLNTPRRASLFLKRRPLARDILIYFIALMILGHGVAFGVTIWHSIGLLLTYSIYLLVVISARRVRLFWRRLMGNPIHEHVTSVFRERYMNPEMDNHLAPLLDVREQESQPAHIIGNSHDCQISAPTSEATRPRLSHQEKSWVYSSTKNEDKWLLSKIGTWIIAPLELVIGWTCPDCRIYMPRENWYLATFLGSFAWVTFFSFVIATIVDCWVDLLQLAAAMCYMGLAVVAVGAEVPDAIGAVTVAKRGYGSMATSACMGSQILNVCIGLGLPWFLVKGFTSADVGLTKGSFLIETAVFLQACNVWLLFFCTIVSALASGAAMAKITRGVAFMLFAIYIALIVGLGIGTFAGFFAQEPHWNHLFPEIPL